MMVALIDNGNADRGPDQLLRGGQSAETRPHDDDVVGIWHRFVFWRGWH
jgi:hypothetical protein